MSKRPILHLVTDPRAKEPICEVCRMPIDANFRDHQIDSAVRYGTGVDGMRSCKFVPRDLLFPQESAVITPPAKPRASEFEWFKWFYLNADFGPADGDVQDGMKARFKEETGKLLPEGYNYNASGEKDDT